LYQLLLLFLPMGKRTGEVIALPASLLPMALAITYTFLSCVYLYYDNYCTCYQTATAYEACQSVQYLDMVLFESLRVYPPVSR